MNAKEGLKLVLGSVVVYVVMAACASVGTMSPSDTSAGAGSSSGGAASASGSSSGGNGSDGSGSSGGSTGADSGGMSLLDALTDPVPAANADTTQSGSRLKAKYYVGSDGSKQFLGWHDSMLNVDCSFLLASDATTRCIPAAPPGVGIATQNFFADAACTQPLGVTDGACAPTPAFITMTTTDLACSTTTKKYAAGPRFTGTLYQGTPAACTQVSATQTMSYATVPFIWYSLGAEIQPPDPSQYVAATVQTDP
jgi:hypothetical protein